jgi:hypothetical protein
MKIAPISCNLYSTLVLEISYCMGQNLVNMDKSRNIPTISSSLTSLSYKKHKL